MKLKYRISKIFYLLPYILILRFDYFIIKILFYDYMIIYL